jgi:hypothetical protein
MEKHHHDLKQNDLDELNFSA